MSHRIVLYYWPIPFRAQFIRYILAHAGEAWIEPDRETVTALYQRDIADQPVPFLAPPVLHDAKAGLWLSQMPAICSYLGEIHNLMPNTPGKDALARKVLNDSVDVLHAMTRNCGDAMWTEESWTAFTEARLPRWLQIFEELGNRHGVSVTSGTLLDTEVHGVADLACAALWVTIIDKLPHLERLLTRHAPNVMALSMRVAATPAIAALRSDQAKRWGDVWCEGEIERSLRSVLPATPVS